jgi:hypothetical protein
VNHKCSDALVRLTNGEREKASEGNSHTCTDDMKHKRERERERESGMYGHVVRCVKRFDACYENTNARDVNDAKKTLVTDHSS